MVPASALWSARVGGVVLGIAAAALILLASRPAAKQPQLGATISVRVAPAGAIAVPGSNGPILAAGSLRPGDPPLRGWLDLRNRGRQAYRVGLRPSLIGLDAAAREGLRLGFGRGADRVEAGLTELAADPRSGVVIAPGASQRLPLTLALPAGAPSLAGQVIELSLSPVREVVR